MSTEYQDLYRAGIATARAKDFDRARKLFLAAVTLDEAQKSGWLALARLETDPDTKADYYRRVLSIDSKDPLARAFIEGMRHARPWNRSRVAIGLLGLLALFLGGTLALLVSQSAPRGDPTLPTAARLPSLTPSVGIELAAPLTANGPDLLMETAEETSLPTWDVPMQNPTFSLELPALEVSITPSPPTIPQQFAPTPTLPPVPTTIFNAPPAIEPTSVPPLATLVTAPPTSANPAAPTATPQPLFMDITEPPPTNLPVFATPTLDYQGDFNTEVPPPDQTFPEDPNSGGMRQP